jgi:galactose-1-phosphate uridylyltransferase
MPEFHKDPVVDRWIIIASERGKRPIIFKNLYFPFLASKQLNPEIQTCFHCQLIQNEQEQLIISLKGMRSS